MNHLQEDITTSSSLPAMGKLWITFCRFYGPCRRSEARFPIFGRSIYAGFWCQVLKADNDLLALWSENHRKIEEHKMSVW